MSSLITNPPTGIILTSSLGDITLHIADHEWVDVALSEANESHALLAERYYPHEGSVTVCDLATLIESDMRAREVSYAVYALQADTPDDDSDTAYFHTIYCDRHIQGTDAQTLVSENFLTTLPIRRVAPDSVIPLALFLPQDTPTGYGYAVTYRIAGDEQIYCEETYNPARWTPTRHAVETLDTYLDILAEEIADTHGTPLTSITILSVTLRADRRSVTLYVDPALHNGETFLFRNCFNALEKVTFSSTTTTKTDVSRSTAHIGGRSEFYNQSAATTYETQSAALTSDEAAWVDQLFTAHEAYHLAPDGTPVPILITDSTCEMHNAHDKLNTVKFTWRYTDRRPHLHIPTSPHIFTEEYTPTFQ